MKFGVFISAQQPRADDSVGRFREAVEQAKLAREAGFDALAAGHHYLSPPYQSLQSLPLLARLAGEAPGMELCLSVLLLALLNPVQTAEEVASLDIMSEGRVVFGIGLGYRDLDRRKCGSRGRAHGAARLSMVRQPACGATDNRAAVGALHTGARRGQSPDAERPADRARAARRADP